MSDGRSLSRTRPTFGRSATFAMAASGTNRSLLVDLTDRARLLRSFLYGIGTFDVATDLGVVGLVTALALVATVIPARRITRIDPARILQA